MKSAGAGTLAALAGGQFYRADLYDFVLAGGSTSRFTSAQVPLTWGANTYGTGLIIKRGALTQRIGVEVQTLDLEIAPQFDFVGTAPTFGGLPFLQAARSGVLDSAHVIWYKAFFTAWGPSITEGIPWFQGRVGPLKVGRSGAQVPIISDTALLNVPMPRNLFQPGCVHTVYDAGCTLLKATFQQSGSASGTPTVTQMNTNLTRADGYFDLAVVTFTSGPNNGLTRLVKRYLNASGSITFIQPLPTAPASGNTFNIVPACKKTQAACSNTNVANGPAFNNLTHFRGYPYVPVPDTLYGGAASMNANVAPGSQGGPASGSAVGGSSDRPGSFRP